MKISILSIILIIFAILLHISTAFAWSTYYVSQSGIQIDFPCNPQELKNSTQDHTTKVYNCEESIENGLIMYHLYVVSNKNGKDIRYKKNDLDLALKNFIAGTLQVYGVNKNNISFRMGSKFQGKFPSVYYKTNAVKGGLNTEGVGSLIDGKLIKIGIIYEPIIKSKAKNKLNLFLNSFKHN